MDFSHREKEEKKLPGQNELLNNGIGAKEDNLKTNDDKSNGEWIALSVALHRLICFIYCIIFAVMIHCYLFN